MFSRTTILELIKALNFRTHDEIERFAFELGMDGVVQGEYIKQKETSISKYLVKNAGTKGPSGSDLMIDVVEYLLKNAPYSSYKYTALENALEKDGYELTETSVRKSLPSQIPLAENEDNLVKILKKRSFNIALGHYEQAIAAHGRGEWAAANAQLRSFVEEFFNRVHALINAGSATDTQQRKIELAKIGFFDANYNEFLHNGTGFVEGFWKRLHPQGSHPGLSEQADSTFRLHLVLLVIHYFAERLDNGLA
ncbi:hypothetical protein LZT09_20335 [Vibrio fluvialis]|uniref:hypothetical protein n=1 Tax=Vibrio fluvialis TaxID=676 RepID=UPI001C9D09E7|nr:hypothetical protein [Vibrio fluvialis]MBY8058927.1 hypothetical protein [Vibrio fluvialis]MCE7616998.1 hypothetical protein [Vibrio fluvialis]